ncbi:PecA family PE domain-processing aspartic protease [Mycolicibacterium vaccae]|uniref:PecA family PE domain-processing aspartic protease n=1 Tax=Mycolicibacterium vaccae TaxID=1810 RepID=UPI003D009166
MLSSATAQAAPDDTSSSSVSAGPASDRSDTGSAARGKARTTDRAATPDRRPDSSAKQRSSKRDIDEREIEIDEDATAEESVPVGEPAKTDSATAEPTVTADADAEPASGLDSTDAPPAQSQPRKAAAAEPVSDPVGSRPRAAARFVTLDAQTSRQDLTVGAAADTDDVDTVSLALQQITAARADLKAATWDSGNVFAGLAAILPQMWLGGAHTSLVRWQENHELLQARFAATVGNPFAHWIAEQRIEASMMRVIRVQEQLEAADKWLGVVRVFTREDLAGISDLIDKASDNGLVYQILDMFTEREPGGVKSNPIIRLSINGGQYVNVLLDTGSLGLVINPQVIGLQNLGDPIDYGWSCYADCADPYDYEVYEIPVSVDDDVNSTATPVLVVTLSTWAAVAKGNGDYEGILGIGANAPGPWTSNPLTALPGLLGRGILIDERRGRAILGPNPYAARVTLEGSPIANLKVKIGDHDEYVGPTWLDTGGLLGTIPNSLIGGNDGVPPGTRISVYTEDGETLLFSYRTTKANKPDFVDPSPDTPVIFGFQPWVGASIYSDFTTPGRTVFNYR